MKIKSVRLQDFKRFSDLTISDMPPSARLVMLLGPNGCGKSCLFDAFSFRSHASKRGNWNFEADYHVKVGEAGLLDLSAMDRRVEVSFHDWSVNWQAQDERARKAFYFRSSYRNEPDFRVQSMTRAEDVLADTQHPRRMIDSDVRVSANYMRMVSQAVEELFRPGEDDAKRTDLRDRMIGRIRDSMGRVFGDLVLSGPGDPMTDGSFFFEKGASKGYRYKNLSGGEKAAFDLLLDLIVKTTHFDDTVFCIDEPDLHMHSTLQGKLLDEMFRLMPCACQLWVATHSVGMVRKAMELDSEEPDAVVFLDLGGHDFDQAEVLKPIRPSRSFWRDALGVAVGDLAALVAPKHLILCESRRGEGGFDARCLNTIFEREYPDTLFWSAGSANEVGAKAPLVRELLGDVSHGTTVTTLLDRDDRTGDEVERLRKGDTRVLRYRHIEVYLWDDEILTEWCRTTGCSDRSEEVLQAKSDCLEASIKRGNAKDDYKSMSGELYDRIRGMFDLTQCGSNQREFACSTLATLITPDTKIYRELREDIFEE